MFLTFKLITCFINGFTLGRKSQSIAYLSSESAHIYWILDLEGEVHSLRVLWTICPPPLKNTLDIVHGLLYGPKMEYHGHLRPMT
jgi:hypothetical protein